MFETSLSFFEISGFVGVIIVMYEFTRPQLSRLQASPGKHNCFNST